MPAPFLIIQTGTPVPPLDRRGGFPQWIGHAAALRADEVVMVDVAGGGVLPAHGGFAGIVVTGSPAMVTERADWSERSARWLRGAAEAGRPILGICYGHQLLAHALGGRVGPNPNGREMGTIEVRRTPVAASDRLFGALPARFPAQATHQQSVLELPARTDRLAVSGLDACQAFRWGDAAWGVQFHPEFTVAHMRGYIRARAEALREEGADPEAMLRQVRPAPHARTLLRRFVRLAR